MKQYLIVRAVEGLNQVANWIALPGLYTLEAAQQFVSQAAAADPKSKFCDPGSWGSLSSGCEFAHLNLVSGGFARLRVLVGQAFRPA